MSLAALVMTVSQYEMPAIKTVETVAFGTHEQMVSLKVPATKCGANLNRVDPLDNKKAVLDIVNASEHSRRCILAWIKSNRPELELTRHKRKELGFPVD